ncbi:MAG TPA: hypothetical protein VHN15_11050 [Thermoanaerobaculia bacterium]|nr:hypothetical protein [Thermoanaerobaculia bacterium]
MAQELRSIQKIGLNTQQAADRDSDSAGGAASLDAQRTENVAATATLQLSVTKEGGPVGTFVEVGSSGTDDRVFNDHELTQGGPARMPLRRGNFYTVVWRGAFVAPGAATLHVVATRADGSDLVRKDVTVEHPPTNSPFTLVVL